MPSDNLTLVRAARAPDASPKRRHGRAVGDELLRFWSQQETQTRRYLTRGRDLWSAEERALLGRLNREALETRAAPRIPDNELKVLERIARKFIGAELGG